MTIRELIAFALNWKPKEQKIESRIINFLDRELPCEPKADSQWILSEPIYEPQQPWGFSQILSLRILQSMYQARVIIYYLQEHNAKEAKKNDIFSLLPGAGIQVVPGIGLLQKYPKTKNAFFAAKMYGHSLGPLIWDSIITNKKATPDNIQELMDGYDQCQKLSLFTKNLISTHKIAAGFFTHLNGIESGIPARVLLASQKPVFSLFGNPQFCSIHFKVSDSKNYLPIPRTMNKKILTRTSFIRGYKKFYRTLKKGATWKSDLRFSRFPSKSKITTAKNRTTVLVAMHCFTDAPHSLKQHIFKDWLEWYRATVESIKQNTQVDWILKRHPASFLYKENFDYLKAARELSSFRHIQCIFGAQKIPISKYIEKCSGVVSCGGSVALEFAAEGKPSLLAADPPWAFLGLSHIGKTLPEYRIALQKLNWCVPLSVEKRDLAKRAIFYYHVALPQRANLYPMDPSFWAQKGQFPGAKEFRKAVLLPSFRRNKNKLCQHLKKVLTKKKKKNTEIVLLP